METVGISLRKMCTPAFVYFMISMFTIFVMFFQNMNNLDVYCLGDYACNTSSVAMVFFVKIIYILFWTWILNIICKSGATWVAWLLVLIPYVLLFVLLFLFMLS